MAENTVSPPNTETIRWVAKIENKRKITTDDAKFIFDQAEKQLKDSIDTSQLIINRTNIFIAVLTTGLIGLVGFSIGRVDTKHCIDSLSLTGFGGSIYIFCSLIYISKNIRSINYKIPGSEPKALFVDNFFTATKPDTDRLKFFYLSEIEDYQSRITQNKTINKNRWEIYDNTVWLTLFIPVFFLLFYLLVAAVFTFVQSHYPGLF